MFCFPSGVDLGELEDCASSPAQFNTKYTVTGQVHKVRVRRTKPLGRRVGNVNGHDVLLWRYGSEVFATGTNCPHQGAPLDLADVEDLGNSNLVLTCPAHSWRFRLDTGELNRDVAMCRRLPTYSCEVDPGTSEVSVRFDALSSNLFDLSEEDDEFSRGSVKSY